MGVVSRGLRSVGGVYLTIRVPKDCIPIGATLVECYETATEFIVCGDPPEWVFDGTKYVENEEHNCDAMGCTSVSHVLYRCRKIGATA